MNLWIVFLLLIILIQSFASNDYLKNKRWQRIKKDLERLKHGFEKSKYLTDLRLYTATIDDTDTCLQPIVDCYCEEIKVLLEELIMSGEKKEAMELSNNLELIQEELTLETDMPHSCKRCEDYEEKSFQEFMNSFETLAQKRNMKERT